MYGLEHVSYRLAASRETLRTDGNVVVRVLDSAEYSAITRGCRPRPRAGVARALYKDKLARSTRSADAINAGLHLRD